MLAMLGAVLGVGAMAHPSAGLTLDTPRARRPSKRGGAVMGYTHMHGTFNAGRNAAKRRARALVASLKGVPGWGWRRRLRQIQAEYRESGARQVPPHRSGAATE
jgi:hypothetical protein